MARKQPLPFPMLVERLDECLGCGYPLEGIPAPGFCPECGVGFDEGKSVLVLAGVAKNSGGPMWRRIVWILIGILAFVYSQLLGILIMTVPWIGLIIFLMLVFSTIAMAMTGKQKKRGSEVFAFTKSGIARWTTGSVATSRNFKLWEGTNPAAFVRRVSSVWASVKIVSFDDNGKRVVPIECGIRCRVEKIPYVEASIKLLILGESIADDHELIEQLDDPSNNPVDAAFNMV